MPTTMRANGARWSPSAAVDEHADVLGGQPEAALSGGRADVVDGQDAGDGLLLEPLLGVAGRDAGGVGELAGGDRSGLVDRRRRGPGGRRGTRRTARGCRSWRRAAAATAAVRGWWSEVRWCSCLRGERPVPYDARRRLTPSGHEQHHDIRAIRRDHRHRHDRPHAVGRAAGRRPRRAAARRPHRPRRVLGAPAVRLVRSVPAHRVRQRRRRPVAAARRGRAVRHHGPWPTTPPPCCARWASSRPTCAGSPAVRQIGQQLALRHPGARAQPRAAQHLGA